MVYMMEYSEDMTGKVCIVTGSNSGIGKETAIALAEMGGRLALVVRSREKGETAKNEMVEQTGNSNIDIFVADLSEMEQVQSVAKQIKDTYEKVDVLVNNAGAIIGDRQETSEGYEMTIALNHFAPLLLTYELIPLLAKSESARVVNVSSAAHSFGDVDLDDPFYRNSYGSMKAYGTSKLMMIMATKELATKLEKLDISVNAVHPGFVRTNFGRSNAGLGSKIFLKLTSPFQRSPEHGAETQIYVASSPEVNGVTGKYFADMKEKKPSKKVGNEELRKAVWKFSNNILGLDWDNQIQSVSVSA
ncbi:MAG: SDR family NAD(P)-dependent oxidoreductase [Candidatus Lokiarchaeota archaeon]|nr:SDR family NAD(P)-dependent oxidoreductase [Candidatus Lokiarchaeota archaeon]